MNEEEKIGRPIRVVIVDDQKLFAGSLSNVIETRSQNIRVLKVLYDGHSAITYLRRATPDILLLDVRLPDINGVEVARVVHEEYPRVRVLMLTTFDDEEYVQGAMANGAVGYLLKDIEPEKLLTAIRAAFEGNVLISPEAMPKLIHRLSPVQRLQERTNTVFTRREEEVLALVVEGRSNAEIADRLNIAEQTVKNQLSTVYSKLGVHSRLTLLRLVNSQMTD
jgi:DNA-binding NarL/FixJ family response regulator